MLVARILILGLALSVAACGGFEQPVEQPLSPVIYMAPLAPPAPLAETMPPLESGRTQIWRRGHWIYENAQFTWVPGEVLTRPSPSAVWSPDRWEKRQFGWAFIPGYWQ